MAGWHSSDPHFLEFKKSTIDFLAFAASVLLPVRLAAYDAAYREYQNYGLPYGDNHAGLARWLKDMQRLQNSIRRASDRRQRRKIEPNKELEAMRAYLEEVSDN